MLLVSRRLTFSFVCLFFCQTQQQCRRPLDFLSLFTSPHLDRSNSSDHQALACGAYQIPKTCEYCGAESTKQCSSTCQRPKSFFRKKRPPFCPPGPEWDPITEYAIEDQRQSEKPDSAEPKLERISSFKWMSELWGGVVVE